MKPPNHRPLRTLGAVTPGLNRRLPRPPTPQSYTVRGRWRGIDMVSAIIVVAVLAACGCYVYTASQAIASRSEKLHHVRKQHWMGCAVATAAMLSKRSYEEVAAHWPDVDVARLRSPRELCALLEAVTDIPWHSSACWYLLPRVGAFVAPRWAVAVWIQDPVFHPKVGQWIVIKDKMIYDPGQRIEYPASSYPLRNWVVGLVAQPVIPAEVARIRDRQRAEGRAR
jgi:hypothetical protein